MAPRAEVRDALEDVLASVDRAARVREDPVSLVLPYDAPLDREIAALVAASLAFGHVKTIRAKGADALARLAPSPHAASASLSGLRRRMRGFRHRVFRGDDVARLVFGAGELQRAHGSLGARFAEAFRARGDLRAAIDDFVTALRRAGGLRAGGARRGPAHILPSAGSKSGMKRFLLFLRWMLRPADGTDLGTWAGLVPTSALVVPLDVHVHRLARNLGLTDRTAATWETAAEITRALAELDPDDPVRYDFALCHMGMLRRCPSRRDEARCEGCPVRPACRHWTDARRGRPRPRGC